MTAVSASNRQGTLDPPVGQAFRILHIGYVLLPLIAGADKFLGLLADWEAYLAPVVTDTLGMDATTIMRIVGGVELVAAVLVLIRPGIGGYVVAAWLAVIIVNLLVLGDFYDVALRDFGLLLGALALARLASASRSTT
ncbi:MAG TPA: hypothetical protein VJ930_03000 [Acidimicrobiia bacterium]|nr:hypothetical protein [Acidimicrobiia bacterium]